MELTGATTPVFAILIPNLQFEFSYPMTVAFLVMCGVAWILTAIDMRRKPQQAPEAKQQDSQSVRRVA